MSPFLGCIADDVTGATDMANMLVRGGLRAVQSFGVPETDDFTDECDAVVVALKSRSIPAEEATALALRSLHALQTIGAQRFFFKYCSTFDSTPQGNIGPVAEALMNELCVEQTLFCPALPENGRTVYCGHLFVHGKLLNESGMERHPLNPMTDANLVRVLQNQSTQKVGILPASAIDRGVEGIQERLEALRRDGVALVISDAINDEQLEQLADALANHTLVTGGSGIGYWLAKAWRKQGSVPPNANAVDSPQVEGMSAVLSGSCSDTTQRQINHFRSRFPSFKIDTARLSNRESAAEDAASWAEQRLSQGPVLIYSDPEAVERRHAEVDAGNTSIAESVERAMGEIAKRLVACGVRRLIVAGGETSGAVVRALGILAVRIGPQIDPGIPWTETLAEPRMALALKSGNFGTDDFFEKALEMLP